MVAFLLLLRSAISQDLFIKRTAAEPEKLAPNVPTITIIKGTSLTIKNGNLITDAGDFTAISNGGEITISGNIVNNSSRELFADLEGGNVTFQSTSTSPDTISGNPINFFQLNLNSTADIGLVVNTDITVKEVFNIVGGKTDISKYHRIILPYWMSGIPPNQEAHFGKIVGETNATRIVGEGEIFAEQIPVGQVGSLGIGVKIDYTSPGTLIDFARGNSIQQHAASGSISKYVQIYNTLSGTPTPTITINYFDDDLPPIVGYDENNFKFWYSTDDYNYTKLAGGTVDVGNNVFSYTSNLNPGRYTISDEICVDIPQIELGDDLAYCEGSSITLENTTGTSNGLGFSWITEGSLDTLTTETISVNNFDGKVKLRLTDQDGCFSWDSVIVNLHPLPDVDFNTNGGINTNTSCLGHTFNFSNLTTIPQGSVTSYSWEFGDGTNSTAESYTKQYLQAGNYTVKLTATSALGCVDSSKRVLEVMNLPSVNFTTQNTCSSESANFNSTSSDAIGISTLTWDFGDGSDREIVTGSTSIEHLYSNHGNYISKLIVTSSVGCVDSVEQNIEVYPSVNADFQVSDNCQGEQFNFINNSTAPNSTIESYLWNFGGLSTLSIENPQYEFTNSGDFDITLLITSNHGCSSERTKQLTVFPLPQTDFYFSNACYGQEVSFDNNSIITSGLISSYSWDFGDGTTSADENASYTYPSYGTYQVKLNAISDNGCINNTIKEITIHETPDANFFAENVCLNQQMEFVNTSGIQSGTLTYNWDFGNGEVSNQENPIINYPNEGSYNVNLEVVSENNCADKIEKQVIVYSNPELDLGGEINTCEDQIIIDAANNGSTYFWSDNSTEQTKTITTDGSYFVIITNANNCSHKEDFNVTLQSGFIPNLGIDTIVCEKHQLEAYNFASTYLWNTGETTSSIEITQSGNYSVAVTDQNDCVGTDNIYVTVNPGPSLDLGGDLNLCGENSTILSPSSDANSFIWSDNTTASTLYVNQPGDYWVKATNTYNCSSYDTISVAFHALPGYNLKDISFCGEGVLDAGNFGCDYLWSNGSTNKTISINDAGLYWVRISSFENCYIIDSADISINELPAISIPDHIEICEGDSAELNAINPNSTYNWSTGQSSSSIFVTEAGIYSVDVENENSCQSSKVITISVNDKPEINLSDYQMLCSNDTLILSSGNSNATAYKWLLNNEVISEQNELSVTFPGMYSIEVFNNRGCKNIDSVEIEKADFDLLANFIVASEIFAGDTVQFINLSQPAADGYLWSFGDGTFSDLESPEHRYYFSSDFEVSLNVTKGQCSDQMTKTVHVKGGLKSAEENENLIGDLNIFSIKEFNVFPNPSNGYFKSKILLSEPEDVYIFLYDIYGKLIQQRKLYNFDNYILDYNLPLKSGVYILKIISRGITDNKKLIIIR